MGAAAAVGWLLAAGAGVSSGMVFPNVLAIV
jgi:hypothetical protein